MNCSSFSRNKPIIWETCGALFAKVIDMTRLNILIIFDIKKIPRSIWNSSTHFRKKGKEPIRYVVVRQKHAIHHQNFWTSQNFPESNTSALARYFSLGGGTPCHLFYFKFFFNKKCFYVLFLHWCFFPHWLRYSVSPICRIFLFSFWDWEWSYFIGMFQLAK